MDSDLTFTEMQSLQKELQEKYKNIWKPNIPSEGRSQLLWMLIEAGEAADIIKKKGDEAIISEPETRTHFIEELCDVMMYFNDVMLCYSVTPDELAKVYREKHSRNMKRW
jgi:NTP pyrophosphatase (non-canonical NTP hydrolase)